MTLEQIKALDRQFIEEVLNGGDIEGCGRFCAEDVVEEVPLPGQGPGLAGLQGVLREMKGRSRTSTGPSTNKSPRATQS